jgi:hypothetical protein
MILPHLVFPEYTVYFSLVADTLNSVDGTGFSGKTLTLLL